MSRQRRYLLDTNVWLDVYLGDREGHSTALSLLGTLLAQNCIVLYPPNALADVAYIVSSTLKRKLRESCASSADAPYLAIRETSWACIENMIEIAAIAPLDDADVRIGTRHRCVHNDLEDNLAIAAGIHADVDFLVTSDKELILHSPLPTMSPRDLLATLEERG